MSDPPSQRELDQIEARVDTWLRRQLVETDTVRAVDRGEQGERRWYVRMAGEERDYTTLWLTLAQRSLHLETYVLPAPEGNQAGFYSHLLSRNWDMRGLWFALGPEDAVFLVGQFPVASIDEELLDRIVGSAFAYVERYFRPALRSGFSSRFS